MKITAADAQEVLVVRRGSLGCISLNRPAALNSLTLGMVRAIDAALDDFEADHAVAAVLLTGEGARGLCAGGDIKAIYQSGKDGTDLAETFWREEYRLNARISHYPKPYVAVMDGVTMGGGVGLSSHGSHRIVTERTRLAMPETGIGFFPDVGASWLLSRAPGELGTYLGLTGETIGAADAILAGLADQHVPSDRIEALVGLLEMLEAGTGGNAVKSLIARHAEEPAAGRLAVEKATIDRIFGEDSVEDIVKALEADGGAFAASSLATIKTRSPTSLKVTLAMVRAAWKSSNLEVCLEREFGGTASTLREHDFFEGVRAAVIDKDRNPRWAPATLEAVSAPAVEAYLAPHPRPLFR